MSEQSIRVVADLGSQYIRVAVVEANADAPCAVLGRGVAEPSGMRHGVIVDMQRLCDALSRAVGDAERESGLKINGAVFNIGGSDVLAMNSEAVISVRHARKVGEAERSEVINAARAQAIDGRYHMLHALPQHYRVDEHEGIDNPIGMVADTLGAYLHIIQVPRHQTENIEQCADEVGLSVEGYVFNGFAGSKLLLNEEEKALGACYVDIGAGSLDFMVWYRNQPLHCGSLPIGGEYVSSDIAQVLRTPRNYAEQIKCHYGSLENTHTNQTVSVPSTGRRDDKTVPLSQVNEIIRTRYAEYFAMLSKALHRGGCREIIRGGIVLGGAAANMPGIDTFAAKQLGVPARVAELPYIPGLDAQERALGHWNNCMAMADELYHPYAQGIWLERRKKGIIDKIMELLK
ncbi:cell division protein FtsA [Suttonella sp. R2A3]|uniref:cell division protein FtsA n=1 Tax=Suttonella sp. R2A3 TaxID=2908648 RepID=UPI001F2DDC22|nr:cell division protein FtsA [Suttonella sp. R2A3]UJF24618.1 cell division protein FtsA [Suttonella sp. R2A3]